MPVNEHCIRKVLPCYLASCTKECLIAKWERKEQVQEEAKAVLLSGDDGKDNEYLQFLEEEEKFNEARREEEAQLRYDMSLAYKVQNDAQISENDTFIKYRCRRKTIPWQTAITMFLLPVDGENSHFYPDRELPTRPSRKVPI
jgi:hypothetical protein